MSTVTLKRRISISTLTRQQGSERWISPPVPHDYKRQTWPSWAPCWSGHLLTCRIPLWRVQCWAGTAAPEPKRTRRALLPNCVLGACCFHPNGTGSSESTDSAILLYARQPSLYRAPEFLNESGVLYQNSRKLSIHLFYMQFKMDVCMNIFLVEGGGGHILHQILKGTYKPTKCWESVRQIIAFKYSHLDLFLLCFGFEPLWK